MQVLTLRINRALRLIALWAGLSCQLQSLSGHEGENDADYAGRSFREHLHVYSAGHGAMHDRGAAIMRRLVEEFDENLEDVTSLHDGAPNDKYLSQLTNFIAVSNLTSDQKHSLYRKSYERCLAEEEEWRHTFYVLLTKTNSLSRPEAKVLLESEDKPVRLAATKLLQTSSYKPYGSPDSDLQKTPTPEGSQSAPSEGDVGDSKDFDWRWPVGTLIVCSMLFGWWKHSRSS